VPIEWPRPVYPQIAQSARVSGDVEVAVDVRPDGSVASARIVSGPPLLTQAALDEARRARFECRGCVEPSTRYSMYVTFRLAAESNPPAPPPVTVSPTQGWITVVAPGIVINGGIALDHGTPDRGLKCLFLWRCDPPPQRARDAHCLWLWRCGGLHGWM
jgi:TonB family protein